MIRLLFLLLLFPTYLQANSTYKCTTEFGEQVPLELVAKKKKWNQKVLKLKQPSKVKNKSGALKTRYLKQKGNSFEFKMKCKEKCYGNLVGGKKLTLKPLGPLFDQRNLKAKAYATLEQ